MLNHIRFSKDKRTEEKLHLATIGSRPGTTEYENRERWNEYLRELGLPQGQRVGTGLPDHLRCRDYWAARILASMPNTAAMSAIVTLSVEPAAVAEMAEAGDVISGEAGPSTAASRATASDFETTSPASHEGAATRLASVEKLLNGATKENDIRPSQLSFSLQLSTTFLHILLKTHPSFVLTKNFSLFSQLLPSHSESYSS